MLSTSIIRTFSFISRDFDFVLTIFFFSFYYYFFLTLCVPILSDFFSSTGKRSRILTPRGGEIEEEENSILFFQFPFLKLSHEYYVCFFLFGHSENT